MTTNEAIKERASYRGKYLDESVNRDNLKIIMEAGLAAPSGCNRQTTSIVAVDDSDLLEQICPMIKRVGATATTFRIILQLSKICCFKLQTLAMQAVG